MPGAFFVSMNRRFVTTIPPCARVLAIGAFSIATAGCSEDGAACSPDLSLNGSGYQCSGDYVCDLSDKTCKPTGSLGIGGDCAGGIQLCATGLYCATDLASDGAVSFNCQPQIGPDAACPFDPAGSCVTGYVCSGPAQAITGTCIPNANENQASPPPDGPPSAEADASVD
jgi:hypothetical protein